MSATLQHNMRCLWGRQMGNSHIPGRKYENYIWLSKSVSCFSHAFICAISGIAYLFWYLALEGSREYSMYFYPSVLWAEGVLFPTVIEIQAAGIWVDGWFQTLQNPYLWNGWMDFLQSSVELCTMSLSFAHVPTWACPWADNWSNLGPVGYRIGGTHISEPLCIFLHLSLYNIMVICPLPHMGWPMGQNLSNLVPMESRLLVCISLKLLDGFTLFKILWNFLDL